MKTKVLFVAGNFDDDSGRMSGFANKLCLALKNEDFDMHLFNGGLYSELNGIVNSVTDYNIVIWMPNVPNDKPKLVELIKKVNPSAILVTSKRNDADRYDFRAMVARALKNKSNLFIEFNSVDSGVVSSLFDPLGNCYVNKTLSIPELASILNKRLKELLNFTRVPSTKIGYLKEKLVETEDMKKFFAYAKDHATKFHEIIHGGHSDRFVGNLSFRCTFGFPSFRSDNLVFVTKRNIDKREIDVDSFVGVLLGMSEGNIKYFGDSKPSVDTPIQVELYHMFPNMKWMMHSHVYIKDAPFTESIVPCGSLEEVNEIVDAAAKLGDNLNEVVVNLKGHGSIVMSENVETFNGKLSERYISRGLPEMVSMSTTQPLKMVGLV